MTKRNIELRARLESMESIEYEMNDTNDSILEGYIIYNENEVDLKTTDVKDDPFKDFGDEIKISDDDLPF